MALSSAKLFLFSPLHGRHLSSSITNNILTNMRLLVLKSKVFFLCLNLYCVVAWRYCVNLGFTDKGRPVWQRKSSMAELDNEELRRLKDVNMDEAPARRHVRDCFKDIQHNLDHILIKTPGDGIKTKESYEVNSRGVEIFSKSWLPEASRPRALVCFCHGYGDTCTFFFEGIARRLALSGYGVFAMDYPGFGLSEGLHGYISSFDLLVEDVIEHFSNIKENSEFSSLPSFLFGQSMGGAVSLKIHFKQPNAWTGAVLVAPMCKAPYNVICYCDKPRLRTAVEMLRTTQEIEQQLHKVCLPILILHGEADRMTDPSVSRELYEKAKSSDKKIVLYKDAFHSLLEGEPDEVILRVLSDIISWLDDHSLQVEGS
ncbi:caffeoylshikimate esterase-like isoform X2 [Brassica napus]|uniref:caffeoylshikimate esterase-like isoform X2 n=1 Tax=Brassica napus TaxID=3708 RepID=UPI0020794FB1|nr:caffeoylshikimate esterase-like isoform X2 [Brassica napus]